MNEEKTSGQQAPREGWGVICPGDRKAHYYRGGMSLCRRVGFYQGPLWADKGPSPDDHKECRAALDREAKRKRAEPIPATIPYVMTDYARAAKAHLEDALLRIETGEDVIPAVDAAKSALLVEAGDLEPDPALLAILEEGGE